MDLPDHGGTDTGTNWTVVYADLAPSLVRFLRRFVSSNELAQDLLHDTFLRAMRAQHVPARREMTPWLYRIATNVALSSLRRARLRLFLPIRAAASVETPGARRDELEAVRTALQQIPRDQAVALVLTLHEGFSRREASEILEIPEETLKSRIARGRVNFANAYAQLEGTHR